MSFAQGQAEAKKDDEKKNKFNQEERIIDTFGTNKPKDTKRDREQYAVDLRKKKREDML